MTTLLASAGWRFDVMEEKAGDPVYHRWSDEFIGKRFDVAGQRFDADYDRTWQVESRADIAAARKAWLEHFNGGKR